MVLKLEQNGGIKKMEERYQVDTESLPTTNNRNVFSIVPDDWIPDDDFCKDLLIFIGREESGQSYSSYLLNNKAFMEFAKLSLHNPKCNQWFTDVILKKNEPDFLRLCQLINKKLIEILANVTKK